MKASVQDFLYEPNYPSGYVKHLELLSKGKEAANINNSESAKYSLNALKNIKEYNYKVSEAITLDKETPELEG